MHDDTLIQEGTVINNRPTPPSDMVIQEGTIIDNRPTQEEISQSIKSTQNIFNENTPNDTLIQEGTIIDNRPTQDVIDSINSLPSNYGLEENVSHQSQQPINYTVRTGGEFNILFVLFLSIFLIFSLILPFLGKQK